jgi:hypothetical protein
MDLGFIKLHTSTVALSDWTSQIGSNCSTLSPGFTDHEIIWHSVIPMLVSLMSLDRHRKNSTFTNVCKKIRLFNTQSSEEVELMMEDLEGRATMIGKPMPRQSAGPKSRYQESLHASKP